MSEQDGAFQFTTREEFTEPNGFFRNVDRVKTEWERQRTESYWRSRLLPEFQAKAVEAVEGLLAYKAVAGFGVKQDDNGRLLVKSDVIQAITEAMDK